MAKTVDVASGQTITSAWGNEIRNRTLQVFASKAERDSQWAAASSPVGAQSVTTDVGINWQRVGSAWVPMMGSVPRFTSTADRDGNWPGAPNGAQCFVDDSRQAYYCRINGIWRPFDTIWQLWTPTVTQGVSVSVNPAWGQYYQRGLLLHASASCGITSSGTAGSKLIMSIPSSSLTGSYDHGSILIGGSGEVYDGLLWEGAAMVEPPGQIVFSTHGAGGGGWGNNPNRAISNGHACRYMVTYRIS